MELFAGPTVSGPDQESGAPPLVEPGRRDLRGRRNAGAGRGEAPTLARPDRRDAAGRVAAFGVGFADAGELGADLADAGAFDVGLAVAASDVVLAGAAPGAAGEAGLAVAALAVGLAPPACVVVRAGLSRTDTTSAFEAPLERARAARAAASVTNSPIFWTSLTTRATAFSSWRRRFFRLRPVSLASSS
jgi:hypothetical protein